MLLVKIHVSARDYCFSRLALALTLAFSPIVC